VKETLIGAAGFLLRFVNFRLYYRFCSLLVRRLTGERVLSVSNFEIKFERNDPYWSQLISKHFKYELELENWLRKECSADVYFVDCGANIGYWSLFVTKVLNVRNFVAIEPNPRIFQLLIENLRLNNLPESALEGAIGDRSLGNSTTNLYLDVSPGKHVGASIYQGNTSSTETFQVPLFNLLDIFEPAVRNNQTILLKLDVEGAEESCIKQIPDSVKSRVRIIYEDHGRDLECLTTKWLMETGDYKIYFLQPLCTLEIISIETLIDLKKSRSKGYNLVAIPQ
jgi:FkbM family methyltransferase